MEHARQKDQKILELRGRMDKMQQVAESNYKSYEKAKQEIDEYRKELEEKAQRRDILYDMPGWGPQYHRLLGWGGRPFNKEERKKLRLLQEQLEERIKNAPPDTDYYGDYGYWRP